MAVPKKLTEYDHKKIEKKWQTTWTKTGLYKTEETSKKPKCYVLDMFPYPSGEGLHVGHPKGYIATDIYSRFKRMNGFNVLHPMGWDAFGLPAENYAIKNKVHPKLAVTKNIKRYKEQLSMIGFNYDWKREIDTTDPEYYKWTQWIFLQLYKKGLAYESFEPINWCPSCQTGLANEDVEDGKCERCSTVVEKKPMRQWVLKITKYADRLLKDLETLDWPNSIKESQKNWIGKSEGALIKFPLAGITGEADGKYSVEVFTTRPDTIFGVTFVAIAPELAKKWQEMGWQTEDKVKKYIDQVLIDRAKTTFKDNPEKTGIFAGVYAINPANQEKVPVWITNYVLGDVGTGAIMAVPAHDERDFEFAKKYLLPVQQVVVPVRIDKKNPPQSGKKNVERKTIHALVVNPKTGKLLCLKWKNFPWTGFVVGGVDEGEDIVIAARREVLEETGYKNLKLVRTLGGLVRGEYFAAHKDENRIALSNAILFELQNEDREPVSDEESDKHEVVWLDPKTINQDNFTCAELDLWFARINNENEAYSGSGVLVNSGKFTGLESEKSVKDIVKAVGGKLTSTYKLKDWVFSRQRYWGEPIPVIHCGKCGVVPVPEKDLPVKLPEVKSYAPTGTGESPLADIAKWVNTKCPTCKGPAKRETNTMPQWAGSSWYYLRFMDPKNKKTLVDPKKEKYWAPVDMYVGGSEHATRHLIYARFWHKFLYDIKTVSTKEPFKRIGKNLGLILGADGRKMSKRWGNVINPDDVIKLYGADTLRLYEMFMGPFDQEIAWNTDSMIGSRRFLEKVWRLQSKVTTKTTLPEATEILLNQTIKKVEADIESFNFNTAVSTLMILVNNLETLELVPVSAYQTLLLLLAPFSPHVADELWGSTGNKKSIHLAGWPKYNKRKLVSDLVTIVVQVNSKVRDTFEAKRGLSQIEIEKLAISRESVQKWLTGEEFKKVIFVPDKLINIVV
ncbi:MAG: class I tRNA ligase family protein [Candidatus Vogelbacteria bacterium]|nr:class I tRNA ligase family protein [Candidatus Vogelbacteria bacterium]